MTARPRPARRLVAATALATGLALLTALPAAAHVRVIPESTAADGWTTLTFRVPNESTTAGTVAVAVDLPTDTPLTSVSTRPVPGWTAVVERGALPEPVEVDGATLTQAPLRVVWTADPGTEIGDGEYQELAISVGPLPAAGTELVLPATQTYSDGTEVVWDEVSTDGTEPEHPAPAFTVTEASTDAHGGAAHSTEATAATTTTTTPDTTARVLGGAALVLAAAALALALRRRSTTSGTPRD
jgi:periplasmic copper chaperone A